MIICFDMWTSTSRSPSIISPCRVTRANTVRPFQGYDAIIMRETTARSRYHGLLAGFRHEAGANGLVSVNYTISRNKADATYDNSEIDDPQNPLDKDAEFDAARTDRTQIFTASYAYELPFGRGDGRLAPGSVGRLADSWHHQDGVGSCRSTAGFQL